jgi:hypothetical protein
VRWSTGTNVTESKRARVREVWVMNDILSNFADVELNVPRFLNILFAGGAVIFALLAAAVKLAGTDD